MKTDMRKKSRKVPISLSQDLMAQNIAGTVVVVLLMGFFAYSMASSQITLDFKKELANVPFWWLWLKAFGWLMLVSAGSTAALVGTFAAVYFGARRVLS